MVTKSPSKRPLQAAIALPRLSLRHALFLDFDGTLIDLAPRPAAIDVPEGLPALLMRLQIFLGSAVAIVSGRTLADLNSYLAPADLDVIAEHGAVVKRRGRPIGPQEVAWPASWEKGFTEFLARHPDAEVERKAYSVAVHFRRVPEAKNDASDLATLLAGETAGSFEVLAAKMAFEIKLKTISKGKAIAALMLEEPFRRRIPVFVGDDVTDEEGFAAVAAMGGVALHVDQAFDGEPQRVRDWLAREIGAQGDAAA